MRVPDRIGRYEIRRRIAAGGMGAVYAAFDPELARDVAIKVLHPHVVGQGRGRARLLEEARALAQLSHENVIPVYDVGTDGDRVFLAMELVVGRTLRAWLRESSHSYREVLDVFIRAGRGLAAAHAQGLVHRDFKPSNVLVGDDGRIRVVDFGIARPGGTSEVADPDAVSTSPPSSTSTLTPSGIAIGTPPYMAPEQHARGPIDERSDQFAFCVSLYEGLYGHRPFGGDSIDEEVHHKIAGEIRDPPAVADVPTWLRQILLRGLALDPDARWPSMPALLDELERRERRRRRRVTWGLGVVATIGIAGALTVLGPELVGDTEDDDALCSGARTKVAAVWDDARRRSVSDALARAAAAGDDGTWPRVRDGIDGYLSRWTDAYTEACRDTHVRDRSTETELDLRLACLDRQLTEVEALVGVLATADADLAHEAVPAVSRLPDPAACADAARLAAVAPPSDPATAAEVSRLREALAEIRALQHAGRIDAADDKMRGVLEAARATGYGPLTAEVLLARSHLASALEHTEAASEDAGQAAMIAEGLGYDDVLGEATVYMVYLAGRRAQWDEAQRWAGKAQALIDRLGSAGTPIHARLLSHLAMLHSEAGETDEAIAALRRAMEIQTTAYGERSMQVAALVNNLCLTLTAAGRFEEAAREGRRAVEISEAALGPDHPEVAATLSNSSVPLVRMGRYEEAKAVLQRALEIRERSYPAGHPRIAETHVNLAAVLQSMRDSEGAARSLAIAREMVERQGFGDDATTMYVLNAVAVDLRRRGELAEAQTVYARLRTGLESRYGPDHWRVATALYNEGLVLRDLGRHDEALDRHRQAIELFERTSGDANPMIAFPLGGAGSELIDLGRPAEAIPLLRRALDVHEARSASPTDHAVTRFKLARAIEDSGGDHAEALAEARRSAEMLSSLSIPAEDELTKVRAWIDAHDDAK